MIASAVVRRSKLRCLRSVPPLRDRVDLRHLLRRQPPFRRLHVLLDLLRLRRAGDDARDVRRGSPASRSRGRAPSCRAPPRTRSSPDRTAKLRSDRISSPRAPQAAMRVPSGGFSPWRYLPREEAARQREVRQNAQPVRLARGHQLALDAAVEQVVLVLRRDQRREVLRRA